MRSEAVNWAAYIEAVARRLCGEPNPHLSHGTELRFGSHGSLSVRTDKGTFYDHENEVGGGTLDLIRHKLGISNGAAVDWLKSELRVEMPETQTNVARRGRIVATYDYFDEHGELLLQAVRYDPKDFRQRRPKEGGGWEWTTRGVRQVPYRLPQISAAPERTVFIVEGEKDVEALEAIGFLATCNAGGAGKWRAAHAEWLKGRDVIVLPDNDDAGRAHADDVVRSLLPIAASVCVVDLPGLSDKGDVSDWLAAGGTRDELLNLVDAAEPVREMPAATHNVVPFRGRGDDPGDQEPPEDALLLFGEPLNDIGNAKRLIAQHGAALRYVVGIGWHVWDGKRYQYDPGTVAARRLAHETVRSMLTHAFDMSARNKEQEDRKKALIKFAVGSGNTSKLNGMLSQAEPHLDVATDDLDRDPWLLNCANGTLDLRTGDLRPHSQDDLITKLVPVNYNPHALCPTWERVIGEIFGGDSDMIDYVQRALGYCLTGMTNEQVVFILHGGGSNGKSLLLEIVAAVLSDYAAQCPSDTFVESNKSGGIPNDIARLVGARFVSIIETEQDRKLAEGLVKQATGGDRMTARFLRQEFFEFLPKFKLSMATNHKPRVRGTDNAIWRRIRLLPFLVTFADPEDAKEGQPIKDTKLKNKLMGELEGILKWLVDGCARWQHNGLTKAPKTVMEATTEYRESQDATAGFVEECCHVSPGLQSAVGDLYKRYRSWCIDNGETAISSTAFGLALEEKGFANVKGSKGRRMRKGIDLKEEAKARSDNYDM